ncbi:undecaprenyl-phosphate glucose phosphotransferase [Corallincola spongiicola]|uniref:Undecaprenyl-phosphate glucose phosphotransferase n=1 Tax=Corallincola spongiicola TaxID=2520508 RepID=A0ABY1WSP8_9GAMM|nr:undecaprenyl-phosphate glucose phosphotransferase [Corallincola spongiicola]TAA47760.1 undecaprenyl-phosphate glucose phosphotransferase [Corallincola spongiicola]
MAREGFIRSHQNQFSTLYRFFDVFIIIGSFLLTCHSLKLEVSSTFTLMAVIAAISFMLTAESMELYRSWRFSTSSELLGTVSFSWGIVAIAGLLCLFLFEDKIGMPRNSFFAWIIFCWVLLCVWRLWYRQILFFMREQGHNTRTVAIIGMTESGLELANQIERNSQQGIRLKGIFDDRDMDRFSSQDRARIIGNIEDAIAMARRNEIDLLYIAMPLKAEDRIFQILERCGDTTVDVHIIPNLFIYKMLHARWHSVGDVQTLSVFDSPLNGFSSWLKRVEDLVLGSLILTLIAIPMMFIALGIKFTSKGPVFFKQDRYGIDGSKIRVWKFRSMRVMDNGGDVKQATKGDPRVTKFGAFLRRTSLDELPQFINVLQGSMSIVGPRPHAVAHNEEYRSLISGYMLRHKVKPGITGLAQISGFRGETDTLEKMEKRVEFDLNYIRQWTVWLDIKIVFLTIFKGFVGSNAY